jgi:glycosyltransferase involved in cell wall biosynthesis
VFKVWNIVDNLLNDYVYGHHLWEPKLLAEELERRGIACRFLGCNSISAEYFPGARVMPVFPLHHYESVSTDPEWGYLENFVIHNVTYERALKKVEEALFADALTLFPNVSERHMLGVIRWLRRLDKSVTPRVAMILKGQVHWSAKNPSLKMYKKIWAGCPPALKENIRLCVRTDMTAEKYEQLLDVRPHVLPSPLAPTEREVRGVRERVASQTRGFNVAYVAGARGERGAALIPEIVKRCAPLGVRFLIQVTDAIDIGSKVESLKALRDRPDVRLHEGTLSRDDYNDWIAQSLVLLPYAAERYQWRSSGVYLEAKCFGSPVIVPSGTWMAEDVSRLGNGLAFEEYSAASIAKCIARAHAELPGLRARAAACAVEYRQQQGVERCVEAIERLFG